MTPLVEMKNVSIAFGGVQAVDDVSITLHPGEVVGLLGHNGAGKSTLIKLILDLIRPSAGGTIEIFGKPNQDPLCREQLAYLPEKFDVRKNVTGRQYLEFIAAIYRQRADRDEIAELAARLDFSPDRLDSRAGGYSKGMVQKLGLVSCFMLRRPLIILDEPLSGLDPRARFRFKELMRDQKAAGRTILYSTHLLADAEDLCDQFGILHNGEMKYRGTPADCIARYATETLEQAYMKCISA